MPLSHTDGKAPGCGMKSEDLPFQALPTGLPAFLDVRFGGKTVFSCEDKMGRERVSPMFVGIIASHCKLYPYLRNYNRSVLYKLIWKWRDREASPSFCIAFAKPAISTPGTKLMWDKYGGDRKINVIFDTL